MMTVQQPSKFYRLVTILKSLKAIYTLTPKQIKNFLDAYDIYDCDWVNGQAMKDNQIIDYAQVKRKIINWYSVINHLCAIGVVEKMYIPPTMDPTVSVINNQLLYERSLANDLNLKKGARVLELGCGKGRVASHLATLTGAHITGINIDKVQLNNAKSFAKKNRLTKLVRFLQADFNDLPFSFTDGQFDCVYEIQALSLSRNLRNLFCELNRILKPGGTIALTEWVRLPKFDALNSHHVELMKRIKPLVGAIGTPTPRDYQIALQQAGFKIIRSADPSVNQSQEILIDQAGHYYDRLLPFIRFLVKIKILPAHIIVLFDRLGKDAQALCEADRLGLVAMSYQFIAQKE